VAGPTTRQRREAKQLAEELATAEQQMAANAAFKLERARLREVAEE
jgi:hypothetical protein